MKKIINNILGICLSLAVFAACSDKDDVTGEKALGQTGVLTLKVETNAKVNVITPEIGTRAESGNATINQFPVAIYKGDSIVKSYESYSAMDNEVRLPVGTYKVVAHSPGEIETKMSKPYFQGEENIDIKKDITSLATVTCKMKNMPIVLNFDPAFVNAFEDWTVVMDDGQNHTLTLSRSEMNDGPVYWNVGDGTKEIRVNIRATTDDGMVVVKSYRCTKSSAEEDYISGSEYFGAGDGLTINFTPLKEDAVPGASIDITVDLNWTTADDGDDDIIIEVENTSGNVDGSGGDDNDDDDPIVTPPVTGDKPSVVLPSNFTYSLSGTPAKPATANAVLKTPAGLKSAIVKIQTDNAGFQAILEDTKFDELGALLSGAEMINNKALGTLFESLELTEKDGSLKTTPQEGAEEYEFPIHAFYTFLDLFTGTHSFTITLTDVNGEDATGTLTITITE